MPPHSKPSPTSVQRFLQNQQANCPSTNTYGSSLKVHCPVPKSGNILPVYPSAQILTELWFLICPVIHLHHNFPKNRTSQGTLFFDPTFFLPSPLLRFSYLIKVPEDILYYAYSFLSLFVSFLSTLVFCVFSFAVLISIFCLPPLSQHS